MEQPALTPARQCEPIAIVGIGCRLPGKASSPSKLWELLIKNDTGHCAVPSERYNAAAYYHPDAERPGSINSTGGYFIQEDIRAFENAFFGINNLEATSMDAQQRKLLEVTYEALENAGVPLETIQGTNTGVYVGNFTNDFLNMQYKDSEYFSRYSATGSGLTVLANRITHCLDLRGPSHVVDTACSSSLYALHSACLALDARDCDAAVVAAANLIQSPEQQMIAVKAGILSPDSICHTFDESANGYGRAEGVSAVYLKRLSDALRDGDPIRSIIRGTSVNGNGRTPGIVQPSVEGQKAVIRAAYRRAGLEPGDTDYIEAHGTGTKVGDPMEVKAIADVFCHRTGRPTLVGGIKPNVGHSEGASGLSSIIKVTLALENRLLPATAGVKAINPSIKLKEWNVDIVTANQAWPVSRVPRASVNSFGFGGSNSHAILEAVPTDLLTNSCRDPLVGKNSGRLYLLPLSARSEISLRQMASNLAGFASHSARQIPVDDLAFTLSCRRSKLAARGFFIESQASLNKGLNMASLKLRDSDCEGPFPLAFIYTGQGAQWAGMGKELLSHSRMFRKTIGYLDSCLRALDPEHAPAWTLEGVLRGDENCDINAAEISQPLCTAVQIALTDLLKDWGALPAMVTGHSSGEIGAAYAAGAIDARQAIFASFFRGTAVTEGSIEGSMAAVGLGKDQAEAIIEECGLRESVTVACANSPESTTVSGDTVAVNELLKRFEERDIWARKLKTGGKAYHSHHMKILGPKYEALLERYWDTANGYHDTNGYNANGYNENGSHDTNGNHDANGNHDMNGALDGPSSVVMISSVTGELVSTNHVGMPTYWRKNLESPVLFDKAIKAILECGSYHLVELGPHSALQLPIKQNASTLEQCRYIYNSSLIRDQDAWLTTLQLVGSLFLHGHDELQCHKMFVDRQTVLVDLPPYSWDYSSPTLWSEPRASIEFRHRKYPRHDLLGSQVLGGSTAGVTWRNVLNLNEAEWLTHHCLGPSVVFPAAAYIAMAVEAMCQVAGLQLEDCPGVELRDLNFIKALDMDPERRPTVEIFAEMHSMKISNLTNSDKWWRFDVVSVDSDSQTTLHMNAAVRLAETLPQTTRRIKLDRSKMQQDAVRVWYDRFTQEGLNWGPKFAVMEEVFRDRARTAHVAAATTHLQRGEMFGQYIAHPISIDAMLQTAFIATTGGWLNKLRATVPVAIDSVYIAPPSALDMDTDRPWYIDTQSENVGFGTVKINAELLNSSGQVLIRMGQARCIAYQGNRQTETTEQRNPLVRATWKPDPSALTSTGLDEYLNRFREDCGSMKLADGDALRLAGALDLACHQRCNSNILELGHQSRIAETVRGLLRVDSSFRRYNTYCRGVFANGDLVGAEVFSETADEQKIERPTGIPQERKFDIVIIPSVDLWTPALCSRLAPGATVIVAGDAPTDDVTWTKVIKGSGSFPVTVATIGGLASKGKVEKPPTILVTRDNNITRLDLQLQKVLQEHLGSVVNIIELSQVSIATVPDRSFVISTLEQQQPLLSRIGQSEMEQLKSITDRVAKIVWVVNGGFVDGENPDFAPVLGLSRALMLEQPSLQFAVLDVDEKSASPDTLRNIVSVLDRLIQEPEPDFEFAQRDGVLHISRWEPDERLNETFRLKQNKETIDLSLASAGRCELGIKDPGQMDTIHFVQKEYPTALHPDDVEISVNSVGMNAKDLYAISAKVDTKDASCSCECAGVITAVGANVSEFKTGDRVVAMAPGHFATVERFPHWAVCKLSDEEDFTTTSTIPIVFSTVIYGLKHRANLQPGETVLIHSAAGGVGLAAIQYAKHLGAKIFATVGNESKKLFLVEKYDLNPAHIFSSRDSSFLPAIMEATSGQGVDVVLNSLTGDLLHSSFKACADFGRFIEIGKRDILDHGVLDMSTFGRNVSFMAFDLSNLYLSNKQSHHQLWKSLLTESLELVRSKICEPCFPIKTFDSSDITDAFRHFSLGTRMGKVTVSFQDPNTKVRVIPTKYETVFSAQKCYLMVGCLGGLGRSLSKWMISCGARRFIFLGRSGTDKPEAKEIVDDLRAQGAHVTVIRGDVCRYEDVEQALEAADYPIGGVIQAAMALSEALWSNMPHSAWHTTIGPKVQGTWNLHNALGQGRDSQLDFFVMTSSISGTVGTATESNYCAANSFLDAFARYRNRLGLPAISIGYGMISEVGYLHEHPDIEALMKRKGIHPINEDELIQIMNMALVNQRPRTWDSRYDHLAGSHLLTGVEFIGLQEQRERGFEGDNHVFADPRAALFTASFSRRAAGETKTHSAAAHLPGEIARALRDNQDTEYIIDALRAVVSKKLSNLILLPESELEADRPLGEFGLDSMLAAEFRTFIFRTFEVDVPFVVLLKRSTTVNLLTGLIAQGLQTSA
ncbi:Acyl transferase/acyl hydrolase/lysophospholipase [Penicillium concentricum]|uniref:Acyl transferase/acyl hydrolase/lysophospholipase n=1 Tax=Penicillium concentricum TaxID=293559 RepID=A0A9W9R9L0_9EURO|nr:Acyl transferase/acyl hydrolase/lysophospholipase [Penicillium concentricum]KAJ5356106.1 Acyl transferase/acyl hydrolase/lysophospholipase [Penicillium concentricum]